MNIGFSVFFTNHINSKVCIDDFIVNVGTLEHTINELYSTLVFDVSNVFIHDSIIGDLVERVDIEYEVDGLFHKNSYTIDKIEFLKDKIIKVYCKSATVKYLDKYMGLKNEIISASSMKELIIKIVPEADVSQLSDISFDFDYVIEDKSYDSVIKELQQITLFEYHYNSDDKKIYFYDKQSIQRDDIAMQKFDERDIISLSSSSNNDTIKINKLYINASEEISITSDPRILLEINNTPQPCSPDEELIFEDNGNKFKINPVNAYFSLYYSPTTKKPILNIAHDSAERVVVEEFILSNDEYVILSGGIEEILAIDGVLNYVFEKKFNTLAFDKVENGYLKITYKTTILYGMIPHSEYPRDIKFLATHYNQTINYIHKIELDGYYPLNYNLNLSLIRDFGVTYGEAINKSIQIYKLSDNIFKRYSTIISNIFGEIEIMMLEYGTYKFILNTEKIEYTEQENYIIQTPTSYTTTQIDVDKVKYVEDVRYIDYYVNKFRITADEVTR